MIDESDVLMNDNCSGVVNDCSSDFDRGTQYQSQPSSCQCIFSAEGIYHWTEQGSMHFLIVVVTIALIVTN